MILSVLLGASSAQALNCGSEPVPAVSRSIVQYLALHLGAADTLEGVHSFWIDWPPYGQESIAVTETALYCLKDQGVVEAVRAGRYFLWRGAR